MPNQATVIIHLDRIDCIYIYICSVYFEISYFQILLSKLKWYIQFPISLIHMVHVEPLLYRFCKEKNHNFKRSNMQQRIWSTRPVTNFFQTYLARPVSLPFVLIFSGRMPILLQNDPGMYAVDFLVQYIFRCIYIFHSGVAPYRTLLLSYGSPMKQYCITVNVPLVSWNFHSSANQCSSCTHVHQFSQRLIRNIHPSYQLWNQIGRLIDCAIGHLLKPCSSLMSI